MTYSFDRSLLLISSASEHRAANEEVTLVTSPEAMVSAAIPGLPHGPWTRRPAYIGTSLQTETHHTGDTAEDRQQVPTWMHGKHPQKHARDNPALPRVPAWVRTQDEHSGAFWGNAGTWGPTYNLGN